MWAAFKVIPWAIKIGILVSLLGMLTGFGWVCYDRGLNVSKVEIAHYETKLATLQGKLDTANARTTTKYVTLYKDRIVTLHDTVTTNTKTIQAAIPDTFEFSKAWIYAYNQSIGGLAIDFDLAKQPGSSKISATSGLIHITRNNEICLANATQLNSLIAYTQETYLNGKAITDSSNSTKHGLFSRFKRSKSSLPTPTAGVSNTGPNNGTH